MLRSSDPRSPQYTVSRDLDVLAFIGRAGWASQPQVAFAVLSGLVKSIWSRIMRRLERRGLLRIVRASAGVNMLALTTDGRDLLIHAGRVHPDEIFVPRRPLSPSMLRHTLWVNDALAVLTAARPAPKRILPSWALQRLLPNLEAIPDLLVAIDAPNGATAYIAIEIDLNTEALPVFDAKLTKLAETLAGLAGGAGVFIHVLTSDGRRETAIERVLPGLRVASLVQQLPAVEGASETLWALARLLGVSRA